MPRHSITMKLHDKKIAEITARAEDAEKKLAAALRDADYKTSRVEELERSKYNTVNTASMAAGLEKNRTSVLTTAIVRAHNTLLAVKPDETDAKMLQRVLGSVQGGLAVALENASVMAPYEGQLQLYPEPKSDRPNIHEAMSVVQDAALYGRRG